MPSQSIRRISLHKGSMKPVSMARHRKLHRDREAGAVAEFYYTHFNVPIYYLPVVDRSRYPSPALRQIRKDHR